MTAATRPAQVRYDPPVSLQLDAGHPWATIRAVLLGSASAFSQRTRRSPQPVARQHQPSRPSPATTALDGRPRPGVRFRYFQSRPHDRRHHRPLGPATGQPLLDDPVAAEAEVERLYLRCHTAAAIARRTGLPILWVRNHLAVVRDRYRTVGRDLKVARAESMLALTDHMRAKLLDRIDAAGNEFSIHDARELREWAMMEAKLLGLLAPEKLQTTADTLTLAEAIAEAERLGIPVPPALYERPPEPLALPPAPAESPETPLA